MFALGLPSQSRIRRVLKIWFVLSNLTVPTAPAQHPSDPDTPTLEQAMNALVGMARRVVGAADALGGHR